jgi:hypothetical protein
MMEHMILAETFELRLRDLRGLAVPGSSRKERGLLRRLAEALLRSTAAGQGSRARSAVLTGATRRAQVDGDAEGVGSKPAERGRVGALRPRAGKYVVDTLNWLP